MPSESTVPPRSVTEFRPIVVVAVVAGVLITACVALTQHGIAAWALAAISILIAGFALHRFRKESLLLRGRATTIATITDLDRIEGVEGGYSYSVQYEFVGPDGRTYVGKDKTRVELPDRGELLPVSYLRNDPSQNLPLATFWFFHFTYTGFRDWMNR